MRYDFSNLSALDFEELVHDLLQNAWGTRLELFKSGRDGGVDLRAYSNGTNLIVQCKNFAKSTFSNLRAKMRDEELPKLHQLEPDRYVLVTSLPLSVSQKDELIALLSPYVGSGEDIIGGNELERMLENEEEVVKRHHKLWLTSIPVLESVLHAAEHHQTRAHVDRVAQKLPMYVQTPAYSRAYDILENSGIVIISGSPGIGKSTLADMLLYEHVANGFTPVVIKGGLTEGRRLATGDGPFIFHFDDFLGETNLGDRPEFLGRREDSDLVDFIEWIHSNGRHRFVLTTREHVLSDALQRSEKFRMHGFAQERSVVTVADYGRDQRARILYNHLWFSQLPAEYLREVLQDNFFLKIVDNKDFNPRIVEWLASYRRLRSVTPERYRDHVEQLLENPHEIWRHAYRQELSHAARDLLSTMHSLSYVVYLDDLESAFGRLHAAALRRTNQTDVPAAWRTALKELEGSFINVRDYVVDFLNPSLRDFMASILDEDPDVAFDIVASATRFHQLERLWRGSGPEGPFPPVRKRLLSNPNMLVSAYQSVLEQPNLRWIKGARGIIGHYIDTSFPERAQTLLLMRGELPEITPVANKAVELVKAKIASWELNIEDVTGILRRVATKEVEIVLEDVVPIFDAVDAQLLSARADDWVSLFELRKVLGDMAEVHLPSFDASFTNFQESGLYDERLDCQDRDDHERLQHALVNLQHEAKVDFSYEIDEIEERLSDLGDDGGAISSFSRAGASDQDPQIASAMDDNELRQMFSTLTRD
ncbi:restriction endonuclease [Ruegeria faecimaris]|uniref:nSTAND3 domain-containing NTPase n=1 Tax=Ruegeria faecimaris TaxID=686389 RepID=UPI0024933747|nr:restriction endonuclease [Ruegeria faecimaris]